jgi:acetyltransferase-like isoleucine patch superfamily enzyme
MSVDPGAGSLRARVARLVDPVFLPAWWPAQRLVMRWRRLLLVVRAKAVAHAAGSRIDVDLAPDVRLGRRILLDIQPGTKNSLRIGSGSVLGDDAVLHFLGGAMVIGERTILRRGFVADSGGALRIGDDVIVSYGTYLHCDESVVVGDMCGIGEFVTIADSRHVRTPMNVPFAHHVKAEPTVIGRNCWLGAHVVVGAGVTVGDGAFVGANSTVLADVPEGWLAAGSPAKSLRPLRVVEDDA